MLYFSEGESKLYKLKKTREHYERLYLLFSAGADHTVALKTDLTVLATGGNKHGQCKVQSYRKVYHVVAGNEETFLKVSEKGYVRLGKKSAENFERRIPDNAMAVPDNYFKREKMKKTGVNLRSLSCGKNHVVGANSSGRIEVLGDESELHCFVPKRLWKNIKCVSAGERHTVGLTNDRIVLAAGENEHGQCDVQGWRNFVAVAAGDNHTVGARADGRAFATGLNTYGQCNVGAWSDIIAVAAGKYHTVGLKFDGTVVATGVNYTGECDVSYWRDIVAVCCGDSHTVGLKKDGTLVATGCNIDGRCNVSGWKLFEDCDFEKIIAERNR